MQRKENAQLPLRVHMKKMQLTISLTAFFVFTKYLFIDNYIELF